MSVRQLKKKFNQKLQVEEESEEEESSFEEMAVQPKKSNFFLLEEEIEEDDSEEETKEEPLEEQAPQSQEVEETPKIEQEDQLREYIEKHKKNTQTTQQPQQPSKSAPKKKNKNKKKKKNSKSQNNSQETSTDIGKNLKEEKEEKSKNPWSLLFVSTRDLNAELEMQKIFGKKVIKEYQKEKKESKKHQQGTSIRYKKTILVKPKENWPPLNYFPTLSMQMNTTTSTPSGYYFQTSSSSTYNEIQEMFWRLVQTHDPNQLQAILQIHPYHIDTLLQLSEIFKQVGEMEVAKDFLEMALWHFESSWHHMFNPVTGNCYLSYADEKNRSWFLVCFRYMQMLAREGCSRTALEYAKFILLMDPADPLGVWFLIDYFCIRSKEYSFLLQLYEAYHENIKLSLFPNWCFNLALASFYQERDTQNSNNNNNNNNNDNFDHSKSGELLQNALIMFPNVLGPLIKKAAFQLTDKGSDLTENIFFSNAFAPPSLKHLTTLFVERNFSTWRYTEAQKWLKENVLIVLKRVSEKDSVIEQLQKQVKEQYQDSGKNLFNHLVLSDLTDSIDQLPAEVLQAQQQGNLELYERYQEIQEEQQRVPAPSSNPAHLFLNTLLPWNPLPNAPPSQTAENNTNNNFTGLIQNLVSQFRRSTQGQEAPDSSNEDEEEEED